MSATPSAQYRLTIRVKIDDAQGTLGVLTGAIGEAGGIVGAVDLVEVDGSQSLRDIVVDASGRDIGSASSRRSTRSAASRSSTPPIARSCCTWGARSNSATSIR